VLAGLVERVTYHNAENGFCVLRARARGHREVVTVVGHAAVISAGEWIMASGQWVNDRTHGQQFKARFLRTSAPTSADGIERYLSSGMIRGVGPVYAKKLVRAFGENVFDVIETSPDRLREVDGIGPVRAGNILAAWAEQKAVREIMVFLHSHGVSTARAVRIFKTYGADAIQVMTDNPYRLARDIRGIGFKSADAIAMKVGIEKTAMVRVRAGISYALSEVKGHVEVKWSLTADDRLILMWTERGGPAVKKPTRQGFGTRMIERMIRDQQNGDLCLDWSAEGLACEIILPIEGKADVMRTSDFRRD
jgi:exodeoxyribonuclease V alpha subunit